MMALRGVTGRRGWVTGRAMATWADYWQEQKLSLHHSQLEMHGAFLRSLPAGRVTDVCRTMVPVKDAKRFPTLSHTLINGDSISLPLDKTSIICIYHRASGAKLADQWRTFASKECASVPFFEISIIELLATFQLVWRLNRLQNASLPQEIQTSRIEYADVFSQYRKELGINNLFTCYVYLVDSDGRIRWTTTGRPEEPTDKKNLVAFSKLLHHSPNFANTREG